MAATSGYPVLKKDQFRHWLGFISPSQDELGFQSVGFYTTLWEAVIEAHRTQKPIALWAMNGHPMACT